MQQEARAQRAHVVTREFRGLQGYKLLPWVPAMLLWWGSEATVLRGDWWLWAFVASLAAGGAGAILVGRWYTRTYGSVRRRGAQVARTVAAVVVGLVALSVTMGGLALAGYWPAGDSVHVFSMPGLVFGLAWAIGGWRIRSLTPATWWLGLALAAVSVAPLGLLALFDGNHPFNADHTMLGVLIALVIVGALASHRALDRALASPSSTSGADQA